MGGSQSLSLAARDLPQVALHSRMQQGMDGSYIVFSSVLGS